MAKNDESQIREIVRRQFASLCWTPEAEGNWDAFAGDFLDGAPLHPSARPVKRISAGDFVARMKGLSKDALKTFHERALGIDVQVFGDVAVAVAACEITENDSRVSRGVEMLLLVKSDGQWKIAAQAWDNESAEKPIPERLTRVSPD